MALAGHLLYVKIQLHTDSLGKQMSMMRRFRYNQGFIP